MDSHLTNIRQFIAKPPNFEGPTRVEVTPYRLAITLSLLALGLAKAILSYQEHIVASTTLDLLIYTTGFVTVYWIGYLENSEPQIWPRFFHKDILSGRLRPTRDPEDVAQSTSATELSIVDLPSDSSPLFKITKHKLFSTVTLVLAIVVKTIYSYRGNSVVSTTMDWLIGIPLTILLYWVGLYEKVRPAVAIEYFHRDLLTGKDSIPEIDPADSLDHAANLEIWTKSSSPVKKTLYRLLNTFVLLAFGLPKAILSYLGHSVIPTTLEMVVGTFFAIILYWMSFWEPPRAHGNDLFFHTDFSGTIPSLGTSLVAMFVVVSIGFHVFGTFSFASSVIAFSKYDNKGDKAARIILYAWWALSLAGFILYILNHIRERRQRSGYRLLGFGSMNPFGSLVGWYFVNFVVVWVGGLIKTTAGNVPAFKGNGTEASHGSGGWHWQVGIGGGDFGAGGFGGSGLFLEGPI